MTMNQNFFLSLKSASGAILKEGSIDGMLTKTREVLPHRPGDGGGVGVVDVLQLTPVTREHIILPDTEVVISKP